MADGVPITPGTGTRVATDEITDTLISTTEPVHFQFVKLVDGTDESTTRVAATTRGLRVQPAAAPMTDTDRSGTITVGGSQQTLMPPNPARNGFMIQNTSTEDQWFNWSGSATVASPSFKVPPDCLYETPAHAVPVGEIKIIGPTTGQSFSAREW